ncbi:DUF4932 domain-containing protein [Xanthovirga aplysinae]|uniref:DUF4932 domain-containing protein n=1 Tax=Xanthovirga aplysinae TaxID=2529853 RepID=UPI0012BBB54E|nr:DUF4932 domain-containing protein [Xanthovirga aplysinae]MTI29487.1 DUF4932 domain-containing protein [Xanthovirga aplysinae]
MKKVILIIPLLAIIYLSLFGQKTTILKEPTVDKRVELLSIVFRLADSREYSSKRFPEYVDRIEKHFGKHREHQLIKFIKEELRKKGVGYDAVMAMAISISEKFEFVPLVPFSQEIPESRWGKKSATTFLKLLNDFYLVADCETFFKENESLYQEASSRFRRVYEELDLDWYQNFYGEKPKGEFNIVNGLGNGGGNYGPNITIDNKEIIYAIMGTWSIDSLGMPKYELNDYFPTLLHEFNHSFVNPVVEKYHEELSQSGPIIFDLLQGRMESQAYSNWKTMLVEAVVRASVIKYLKDHDYEKGFIQNELNDEINRGFLWTDELVEELERYDNNRVNFPALESFMPEIVKFFDRTASRIDKIQETVNAKRPKVIEIIPFENGSQEVEPSLEKIKIVFDRPLKAKGYSISHGDKGKEAYPKLGEITYSEDKKSVFLELDLESNKEYQFILTGRRFKTEEGFGMNNYEIGFKTKNE